MPRDRLLARWTKRASRPVNREIDRQPVNADVEKRADSGTQDKSEHAKQKVESLGHQKRRSTGIHSEVGDYGIKLNIERRERPNRGAQRSPQTLSYQNLFRCDAESSTQDPCTLRNLGMSSPAVAHLREPDRAPVGKNVPPSGIKPPQPSPPGEFNCAAELVR